MAVSLKEFVEKSGVAEEVEDELTGIKELKWDMLSYEDNLKKIDSTMKVFHVHINELMSRIEELKEGIKDVEELAKKEAGDPSGDVWYQLYEREKDVEAIWFRIIGYLALQIDVLSMTLSNLMVILKDARESGIIKQKLEVELEILKTTVDNLMKVIDTWRQHMIENDRRVLEVVKSVTGVSSEEKIAELEEKIEELEQKIEELEEMRYEEIKDLADKSPQSPPEEEVKPEQPQKEKERKEKKPESKKLSGIELTLEIERLVREEGITSDVEIAKRLGVSPLSVRLAGFKEILERYSSIKKGGES
jgi:predicted RNase H-like nuclease (RuvC/YqgF family)